MSKLPNVLGHMLTALCTAVVFAGFAYWVLHPIGWRGHLLSLFARAFVLFTKYLGTNGPGWIVSVVGSSVFTIIATVALVGLFRGGSAMREHWIETAAIALLAFIGQIVLLYGPIYLRKVTETVYEDHQELVTANTALAEKVRQVPLCPAIECPSTKGPDFVGSIELIADGEDRRGKTLVVVVGSITNRAEVPSGANNWKLRLEFGDSPKIPSVEGEWVALPAGDMTFPVPGGLTFDLPHANFFPLKTEQALCVGCSVLDGWFWAVFPTIPNSDYIHAHKTTVVLEFTDVVTGRRHVIKKPVPAKKGFHISGYDVPEK